MDVFKLSRQWFDFCFENPDKVTPNHAAIYFFAIEHCNRLGWKQKFSFPTQMAMEAIGIKNWRTFIKAFNDLVEWKFIDLVVKSKNQYSANVIAIVENTKANTKALDKALQKHSQKQSNSIVGIDIQETIEQETINKDYPFFQNGFCELWDEYLKMRKRIKKPATDKAQKLALDLILKYYGGSNEKAKKIVEQSILNSWQGIFDLKAKPIQKGGFVS